MPLGQDARKQTQKKHFLKLAIHFHVTILAERYHIYLVRNFHQQLPLHISRKKRSCP